MTRHHQPLPLPASGSNLSPSKDLPMLRTLFLAALFLCFPISQAAAQRNKPAVPDLTQGEQPDELHDWNLGPTGARGWMWGWKLETSEARQIFVPLFPQGYALNPLPPLVVDQFSIAEWLSFRLPDHFCFFVCAASLVEAGSLYA